jgi:putative ABC transport system permease protein
MNLFQLVFKQMRQRALSTWLTTLTVLLGVALAVAIMIVQRGGRALFGQSDFGYDVIVGPKGAALQLVLNTVYHLDQSPGNIPYSIYEELNAPRHPQVRHAVPFAVGDTFKGLRIVGTTQRLFGLTDAGKPSDNPFQYRLGKTFQVAQGQFFHPQKFEAVIGSDVPRLTGLTIGSKFRATHGEPVGNQEPDEHAELWEVVGILEPTRTANDRVLFIPLITFYAIGEHEIGLQAQAAIKEGRDPARVQTAIEQHKPYITNDDGTIELLLPKDRWQVSAILVRSRSPFAARTLMYALPLRTEATAVNPADVMREFFNVVLKPSTIMLQAIAFLVTIVAAVGILVSIYNSISARNREIAILRALGATRAKILTLICLEAALIGLIGGILGLIAGHLIGAAGSIFVRHLVGEGFDWLVVGPQEWIYLGIVVALAVLAGLVPALKAYRTPVATNLVAG